MALITTLAELAQQEVEFEGNIPWMYLDTAANVTVGVGFMLPDERAAEAMRFRLPNGLLAHPLDIIADFHRVKAKTAGMDAEAYKCPTSVYLSDATIMATLEEKLDTAQTQMCVAYPAYTTWPATAKMGALDMGYNLGVLRLQAEYPDWDKAVQAQDWKEAAVQCARNAWLPAFAARNEWTKQQFLAAI